MEQSEQCSPKTQKKQIKLKWLGVGDGEELWAQNFLVRIRTNPDNILKEVFASNLKKKPIK